MIDLPFLFLARVRLHSYPAFIRERHSAGLLHCRRAERPSGQRALCLPQRQRPLAAREGKGGGRDTSSVSTDPVGPAPPRPPNAQTHALVWCTPDRPRGIHGETPLWRTWSCPVLVTRAQACVPGGGVGGILGEWLPCDPQSVLWVLALWAGEPFLRTRGAELSSRIMKRNRADLVLIFPERDCTL